MLSIFLIHLIPLLPLHLRMKRKTINPPQVRPATKVTLFYQSLECMQQFTLMLNSSLLLQLIILICQSISQQPLNFGLHHHLPHQSIVVHLNIQMNHYHLIPNYWIIPLHLYVMHQQDRLLLSQLRLTFPSSMDGTRN